MRHGGFKNETIYSNLKRWQQLDVNMLERQEKDIEKLKEDLESKLKFYEHTKKGIEKYDKEIANLLNK